MQSTNEIHSDLYMYSNIHQTHMDTICLFAELTRFETRFICVIWICMDLKCIFCWYSMKHEVRFNRSASAYSEYLHLKKIWHLYLTQTELEHKATPFAFCGTADPSKFPHLMLNSAFSPLSSYITLVRLAVQIAITRRCGAVRSWLCGSQRQSCFA